MTEQKKIYKKAWFLAAVISLAFLGAFLGRHSLLMHFDGLIYDTGTNLVQRNPGAAKSIVIINMDADVSGSNVRPQARNDLSKLLKAVAKGRPRAMALELPLADALPTPALEHFEQLEAYIGKAKLPKGSRRTVSRLKRMIVRAKYGLNVDRKLAAAISQAGNVYLMMSINEQMRPAPDLLKVIRQQRLKKIVQQKQGFFSRHQPYFSSRQTKAISGPFTGHFPLPNFALKAAGIGHVDASPDRDGIVRALPVVTFFGKDYYPSLALLLASRALKQSPRKVKVLPGTGVTIGRLSLSSDANMRLYPSFYHSQKDVPVFASYNISDILEGKVPLRKFRNKIVLIGHQADRPYAAPAHEHLGQLDLTAHFTASILNQDFYHRPASISWIELGILLSIGLYLTLLVANIGFGLGAFVSFIVLLALLGTEAYFLIGRQIWLQCGASVLLLVIGQLLLAAKRAYDVQHLKYVADTAYANRQLGLVFQEQGKLDMAMERFRHLPVDSTCLELVYNLALDFERKRKFGKAAQAYRYIIRHDPGFKDTQSRRQRAEQIEQTMSIGPGGLSATQSLIIEGFDQKPTLGRYVLEKALGRGAMGTVYLGCDPTIDRIVAIKTLPLTQEFDEEDLGEIRERFFHEASAAGRLNHPNIVTIYDAGEEHDLAYIAMEYIEGKDLNAYSKQSKLLPIPTVLEISAMVADALDFAHKQEVIHRDIKPANIVYNEKNNNLKITDFGIARITATSKTKTGVILGTPSFMSPEQMAGKPVDGRSDLFSLATTMYTLLTAQKPFPGDSIAALSYQITHDKHPDICKVRKDIPACVRNIIDKALEKEPGKRYQSGAAMKRAIERCLNSIKNPNTGAKAKKKS